jgi:hypothetical protein
MTGPKRIVAASSFVVGLVSLDWTFFAVSGVSSLAVIAIGIKAAGWRILNPFGKSG